jgi:hypothetical protein
VAGLIGLIIGGVIAIYLLSLLIEWALFKRILDDPRAGGLASTACAFVLAVILYGFGNANGGAWNPMPGAIAYLVGAVIVAILRLIALRGRQAASEEDLSDTFN